MFVQEIVGAFTGQNTRDKHRAVGTAVVVTALLAGSAGIAAGLLCAPQAGAETRQDVADFAKKSANTVKDAGSQAYHKVAEVTEKTVRDARDKARQLRRSARNVGDELHDGAEDIGQEIKETAEDVADAAKV